MKVLWICNLILPEVAQNLGLGTIPKEGWVKSMFDAMLKDASCDADISIAFPVGNDMLKGDDILRGFISGSVRLAEFGGKELRYYGFYEDTAHESVYDKVLEQEFAGIYKMEQPDLVHSFGTEFPHTLAAAKVWDNPMTFMIGIQGICEIYATRYTAQLPEDIINKRTFRDLLKKDGINDGHNKFVKRGENEIAAVKLAGNIFGRTDFDREFAMRHNPDAKYFHGGENLRTPFYSGEWSAENAERGRLFVSQADYPIKGFHYLLIAVGELLKSGRCPENLSVYVAGHTIMGYDTLKEKIKISGYGKYLRSLMDKYNLWDRVHILGRLSAEQMKEQYQKCDTFVCCSSCENSPNSLGEAMMLGVPVVTAGVGGISSMFTAGVDGFLYRNEPEDSLEDVTKALADALVERWNCDKLDELRANAHAHAMKNHNREANAAEMLEHYRTIYENNLCV